MRRFAKKYGWDEFYMDSKEYRIFLDEEEKVLFELLQELGLGKKQ